MADNTFNFDLDAPAVPTLTLDPVEAPAAEEKQPEQGWKRLYFSAR